jgi:hypothetical protein
MSGEIGRLAEEVLAHVKGENLVKLAEYRALKNAYAQPTANTLLGQAMLKLAEAIRSTSDDVSVADVRSFLKEVGHAE